MSVVSSSVRPIPAATTDRALIDPRGPQFAAGLTSVVLAAVLVTGPSPVATGLLALQAGVFALGAGLGVVSTPYAWLFRTFVRPRLGPPAEWEDARPPRFAQAVGLAFAAVGVLAFLAGAATVGLIATGFALAAALLNAAFGFCLGCEVYLLAARFKTHDPKQPTHQSGG